MREEERAGPGGRCSIDLINRIYSREREGERREMKEGRLTPWGIAKVKTAKYNKNNNQNNNNINNNDFIIIIIIITTITIIKKGVEIVF